MTTPIDPGLRGEDGLRRATPHALHALNAEAFTTPSWIFCQTADSVGWLVRLAHLMSKDLSIVVAIF